MSFEELVTALCQVEGFREKGEMGKVHPNLHFRSTPVLHVHSDDGVAYAHVRFGDDFEHVPADTDAERRALLDLVIDHAAAMR